MKNSASRLPISTNQKNYASYNSSKDQLKKTGKFMVDFRSEKPN